ncbi:MAG: tRNA uridine-5-carboxymethylaminomethyl(34) synthesis GTPase MnmE [Bdellovibrionaceae bacterium]|nr:tRNA uridine-5-carboxymethylaminomethyl(34) synthesis GTPase MnmE [Pseudobdellovibrionaceae bacterium]
MNFGEGRDHLTICSVSTPMGYGGISVIRVSGPQAFEICQKSFKKRNRIFESHKAFRDEFLNAQTQSSIDEVLVLPFEAGKSFTGERVVEISCHGSPVICTAILNELCRNGCALAINGEFTYRAFMNDRLDLVQAESVLSLIHSHSELGTQLALRQLKGELSVKVNNLKNDIVWCLAHIEAGIDFSEQGITVIEDRVLIDKLNHVRSHFEELLDTYETGRVLKDGIVLVLSGEPNVGKSSLMNILLESDRSIVSEIAGTTRDVIREDLVFKNLKFTLVDTAGIRVNSNDPIEKIGVERSFRERQDSFVNLVVLDVSRPLKDQHELIFQDLDLDRTLFILNKVDLVSEQDLPIKKAELHAILGSIIDKKPYIFDDNSILFTSCKCIETKHIVLSRVYNYWIEKFAHLESVSVSSTRQKEELRLGYSLLLKVIDGLNTQLGSEFIAFDLKNSLMALQRTVGEVYDDQILDKVFKEFCLGK